MTNSFVHSLKWSFASEIASKSIQPIIFIILARLLTPEDFGIMAAAIMVISFSQIFWEAGMAKALIQRQTDVTEAANAAFLINIGLGSIVALLIFLSANFIAEMFFNDSRVTLVMQVMTVQVFLGAISSVHIALLKKKMNFNRLFWVRFTTVMLPGLASIPLAWNGMGYWALVAGALVGDVTKVVMLWRQSSWRPKWSFNKVVAREMITFSKWVAASGLLAWFFAWADSLIVGSYLGIHNLGLYRLSKQIVAICMDVFASAILPVAYSKLSMHQDDLEKIKNHIFLSGKGLVLILFPIGTGIYLTADLVIPLIMGEAWKDATTFIGILALARALAYSVTHNQEAIRAIGRSDVETKVMFISMTIRLVFYLLFIEYGLFIFSLASLVSTGIGVINHLIFAKIYLELEFINYFKMIKNAALASFIMAGIGLVLTIYYINIFTPVVQIVILVLSSVTIYSLVIYKLEHKFISEIIRRVKNKRAD